MSEKSFPTLKIWATSVVGKMHYFRPLIIIAIKYREYAHKMLKFSLYRSLGVRLVDV